MTRILVSFIIALSIHAAFLLLRMDWFQHGLSLQPGATQITVTLSQPKPPVSEVKPVVPPKVTVKKKIEKKVLPKSVKPRRKQAPVPVRALEPVIPPLSVPESETEQLPTPPEMEVPEMSLNPDDQRQDISSLDQTETVVLSNTGGGSVEGPVIRQARPLYRQNPPPKYPRAARRSRRQGTVILEVLVRPDGRVGELKIGTSSGFAMLDRAALKSVRNWLFEPGTKGDEKVEMWVKVPIKFQLQ